MGSGVISLEVKLLVLKADKSLHLLPGLGISGDVTPLHGLCGETLRYCSTFGKHNILREREREREFS